MKLLIVIPAFNEARIIGHTVKQTLAETARYRRKTLLVIDDGSRDNTQTEAQKSGAEVIRHSLNRGLGGAIGTGVAYAKKNHFDIMVTLDADGQHNPKDIHTLISTLIRKKVDVVIGSRTLSQSDQFPRDRQLLNHLSNYFTRIMFGIYSSDSQSGFRAFGKRAIGLLELKTQRMEVSSEIFSEIKRNELTYTEVPIQVIYTSYSRTKGQSNFNAINIIIKSFIRLFR